MPTQSYHQKNEADGKIEMFHKTIKHDNVYIKEKYNSFYEAEEDIANFIEAYNNSRLHQGIEFVTPYDKYTSKADQIIKTRNQKHQEQIERRKRLNKEAHSKVA
ncbi:integrase core domain-containing protein [Natroniella acetigena]|uniref:integrase core domain-containing protein n=1 Tax=Natroniella acetigena TaxID=52004 RepID=UPI00200AB081|nr:integrase core domain-containing protein [Natroniella acetigena]MCK8827931.1 integrase core domain-containing protein [Natroniella acetigena]